MWLEIALTIAVVLLVVSGAGCAWLYASLRASRRAHEQVSSDRSRLETINLQHLETIEQQRTQLAEKDTHLQLASQREAQLGEQLAAARDTAQQQMAALKEQAAQREQELRRNFEAAQKQARDTFDALAVKALKESNAEFLKLAKEVFGSEHEKAGKQLEANKAAVEGLIKPVRESLDQYQKQLLEAEKTRAQAYGSLKQQAELLSEAHRQLQSETANLVRALRKPQTRGTWGEMVLERVLEISGLQSGVAYKRQVHMAQEDGALRPDVIIYLPTDRFVVIDAKAPMAAYLDATEAEADKDRDKLLDNHARQLAKHVNDLSGKRYSQAVAKEYGRTADFVVMFLPAEALLQAALSRTPSIMEDAMSSGVVIATPTILLGLLKTVAMGWHEKAMTENAEQIAKLGRDLHERLCKVMNELVNMGTRLGGTVKQYNDLIRSFDARLMPAARKFVDLKATSPKAKDMPNLEVVTHTPRQLSAPESASLPSLQREYE
jgi:DNA recombination protein RmuC